MPVLDQREAVTREQQDHLFLLSFSWDANGQFTFDAKKCVYTFVCVFDTGSVLMYCRDVWDKAIVCPAALCYTQILPPFSPRLCQ